MPRYSLGDNGFAPTLVVHHIGTCLFRGFALGAFGWFSAELNRQPKYFPHRLGIAKRARRPLCRRFIRCLVSMRMATPIGRTRMLLLAEGAGMSLASLALGGVRPLT